MVRPLNGLECYWVVKSGHLYATGRGLYDDGRGQRTWTRHRARAFRFTTCLSGPFKHGRAFARAHARALSRVLWTDRPRVVRVVARSKTS